MNVRVLSQLFSLRDLRNAVIGVLVIVGGLGLSGLTLYAHQIGNLRLAGIAAGISLVFVLLILIFVVPPLARNAGREASQMNLPFEFTAGGAIILGLIMVVGFSAWNTGNNLLFLVLSFLIGAVVVGFFAGRICLRSLDVTMRFPETILAGEPAPILVTITNRKRLFPAFSVVIEVRGRERERSVAAADLEALLPSWLAVRLGRAPVVRRTLAHFPYVSARDSVEIRTEHTFSHRGRLLIKDFELSTKFPFGFFRHRRRLPAREAELIVCPSIVDVDPVLASIPTELGRKGSHRRGTGQDLLTLREYRPNDDLRHIDWKATARSQGLTVREFASEDERRITVVFDTHLPQLDGPRINLREKLTAEQEGKRVVISERFEEGAKLAASLLTAFAKQNALIALAVDSDVSSIDDSRGHLYDQLRRLAIAEPAFPPAPLELPETFERILNVEDNRHYILVTANGARYRGAESLDRLKIIDF